MRGSSEAPTVGGLLAEVLAGRAARVAELWPRELPSDGGEALAVPLDQANQLVRAVAVTLESDDPAPLLAIAMIRPDADMTTASLRVERVLRGVDAVRRALVIAVEEEGAEPGLRAALQRQAPGAFARIVRVFAAAATRVMIESMAAAVAGEMHSGPLAVTIHELRRPLTILTSYVQLLVSGTLGEMPERMGTAVVAMAQATETMSRLVDGLSAVARLEDPSDRPHLVELRAVDVTAAAINEVALEAELRGVELVSDVDAGLVIRGDREELVLALRNLLGNAVKHAPEGSAVTVAARADDGAVRLVVRDRGPGFPPQEAARLFEKYYRSAAERDQGIAGTGLGLFIVATVARRHGGSATARHAPDGGAEFELALPLSV